MSCGLLLLDKPPGLSSNAATQRVRRLLREPKAGHVGSLDPLATGMLPVCLGEATKLAGEVLDGDKVYAFRIALGRRTATGDAEGEVVETAPLPPLEAGAIRRVLAAFLGRSLQVPPMYTRHSSATGVRCTSWRVPASPSSVPRGRYASSGWSCALSVRTGSIARCAAARALMCAASPRTSPVHSAAAGTWRRCAARPWSPSILRP